MTMNVLKGSVMLCAFCVALAGCGKQHKAERVVNDFIDANAASDDYTVKYTPLDSTDRIPAERIAGMKKAAISDPLFKQGLSFGSVPADGKYIYTTAKFINGKDTVARTFYLDAAITQVIAFKEN